MLLLGGGFALAKAIDVSGLSLWIGSKLEVLDFLDPAVLCLIVCLGCNSIDIFLGTVSGPQPVPSHFWSFETYLLVP